MTGVLTALAYAGLVALTQAPVRSPAPDTASIGDWLLRRAAIHSPAAAARMALYARIRSPVVRARLLQTEAEAREASGDLIGAALRYDSLGRVTDAARLRLSRVTRAADRARLLTALAEYVADHAGTSEADSAMALLFRKPPALSPQTTLLIARAAVIMRQPARAVPLFERAFGRRLGGSEDRLSYGRALMQLGRARPAIAALARITMPEPLAAEAAFQSALAWQQAEDSARVNAGLRALLRRFPDDSTVAPKALFLAGDLAWRAGRPDDARARWLELAARFPMSPSAGRASFLAGLVRWESGRFADAAEEWSRQSQTDRGAEGLAAGYWAGRAWEAAGDRPRAEAAWRTVLAADPLTYYAIASARRLGTDGWRPAPAAEQFLHWPSLDSALTRITDLRDAGMDTEAGWESDWLLSHVGSTAEELLSVADGFRRIGQPSIAVSLARRALKAGAPADARTYRLIYPFLHEDEVRRSAADAGLAPSLVAGLIRQESVWEPSARSRVGALGLMQLMPATGKHLARRLGLLHGWSSDRLLDPSMNIRIGTQYLAATLRQFDGDLNRALAGYNAGPSRVMGWAAGPAAGDPDLFVERITFAETRDYVRIVQRNVAAYRVLYPEATP